MQVVFAIIAHYQFSSSPYHIQIYEEASNRVSSQVERFVRLGSCIRLSIGNSIPRPFSSRCFNSRAISERNAWKLLPNRDSRSMSYTNPHPLYHTRTGRGWVLSGSQAPETRSCQHAPSKMASSATFAFTSVLYRFRCVDIVFPLFTLASIQLF